MIDFMNVTKNYGKNTAIDHVTLALHEPKIYCLLGRNGAGKTTFMNLIAGMISASEGEVAVSGATVSTLNMPENVRYIEAAKSQFNMKIKDLIQLAKGIDSEFDYDFAMEMVQKFKLDGKKKYKALSFGMKTMVTTIISLASNAEVILLDEPVLGFDAVMRAEFYELLQLSFANHPRIIVVSTHLLDEIANVAEQIIMIEDGKIVMNEDINAVLEKAYKVTGPTDKVKVAVEGLQVIATEEIGKFHIAYVYDKRIAGNEEIEITNLTLNDLFVKLAGGKDNE